jgi:hypothetical protein
VWYVLIVVLIGCQTPLAAQESLAPAPGPVVAGTVGGVASRTMDEPVVLSAHKITEWTAPDGRWVRLYGESAVLQGVEGLRAREAIIHIIPRAAGNDTQYSVRIYAEGDVRVVGEPSSRQSSRMSLETSREPRLSPYDAGGLISLKQPPRPSPIALRSGLLAAAKSDAPAMLSASSPSGTAAVMAAGASVAAAPHVSGSDSELEPAGAATSSAASSVPLSLSRAPRATSGGGVVDPQVVLAAGAQQPGIGVGGVKPPDVELPPIDPDAPEVQVPNLDPDKQKDEQLPDLPPLPGEDGVITVPALPGLPGGVKPVVPLPTAPILAGSQRVTTIQPRSGRKLQFNRTVTPEGVEVFVYRGGIIMVTTAGKNGTIDIEADEAVLWKGPAREKGVPVETANGQEWVDDDKQPMEIYLEGNVILRQDENKWAGKGDQKTIRAPRLYYDFLTDRCVAPNAEIDMFAPGLLAPVRIKSPRIEQFRPLVPLPNGTFAMAEQPEIRLENTIMTGSRFPDPGYSITSKSLDLTRFTRPAINPNTQKPGDPDKAQPTEELIWRFDARQNFYWMGWIPTFYLPRIASDVDDLEQPVRQFGIRTNNYFGQQVLTDWNAFRLFQIRRPDWIDQWNVDIDYLSARTKDFPALGSEMGWYGTNFLRDITDPYHRQGFNSDYPTQSYFGYFDIWGLKDSGIDDLGTGPGIVTNGPPGAGKAGFQRSAQPPFQEDRGRFNIRHMQRFFPDDEDHDYQDLRLQFEAAYASDRNFIEEYYKNLFDRGMDQETLVDLLWQKDNQYANLWTEANLQNWYTDTQWLPRADYYRLGDSFFDNRVVYYTHSGMDYATIHTDIMVNNPNLFAYMPYDPISNTSGTFSAGRFYTNHELDVPLNFGNMFRLVPYVQGQLVGWTDQLGGGPDGHSPNGAMGRAWGAAGLRAEVTAWKKYGDVENELMNVHGLNNKVSLFADARAAFSNQNLNSIAVQDDLDDNTYEYVRRYLALTSFAGGILPTPYDPRHLLLRQTLSPITGTTDVQASIDTVMIGIHQRLQTKRGPVGRRRIVDYMTLDASTTYFPNSARDNFNTPWGQAMYNYQWYIGDRTSIVSSGWFDFWKLVGSQPLNNNMTTGYNPNGLNIITSGISISRPPRANYYLGYSIIDSGPIKTSAINASISYWLSPKWYGTFGQSYDFGDAVSLGTVFSFTRIGADYLTSVGLTVDPQRGSYMFAFQLSPRLSPGLSAGSSVGGSSLDTRFAPAQ